MMMVTPLSCSCRLRTRIIIDSRVIPSYVGESTATVYHYYMYDMGCIVVILRADKYCI